MTGKEYLQSIRDLKYKLSVLKDQREFIARNIPTRAITYDNLRVQTSPSGDELENNVIKIIEECEKIDKEIIKASKILNEKITKATDKILKLKEGQCRRFLIDYYINNHEIKDLIILYDYESRSIYELKKRALKKFENVYK